MTPARQGKGPPLLTIDGSDSIETVLIAMKSFPEDPDILEQALDQLSHRCKKDSEKVMTVSSIIFPEEDARSTIQNAGGVPLVIATLQKHPSLQENARRTLLNLLIRPSDGITKIVETMNKYPALDFVQEQSCRVLSDLIRTAEDFMARSEIRECGGIGTLIAALNDPHTSLSLRLLAIDVLNISSANATNCIRIQKALPILIEAMADESCTIAMNEGVCSILSNLARTSKKSQTLIAENGGIAAIICSMTRFSDASTVKQASLALAYACKNNETNCRLLAESGGVSTIVKLVEGRSDHFVVAGTALLQVLTSDEALSVQFADEGGIDALLVSAKLHPETTLNQASVFLALSLLAQHPVLKPKLRVPEAIDLGRTAMKQFPDIDWPQEFLRKVGEEVPTQHPPPQPSAGLSNEGLTPRIRFFDETDVILQGMSDFVSNSEVQEQACKVLLFRLQYVWNSSLLDVQVLQCIELSVSAMQNHEDSVNIHQSACGILHYVAKDSAKKERIIDAGGIKCIVQSMNRHSDTTALHQHVCALLTELLVDADESTSDLVVSVGGIPALVNSMRSHSASYSVQADACEALSRLAKEQPTNRELVADAGGIVAVVSALRLHPQRLSVREAACSALCNLAEENESNQILIVDSGGLGPLVSAVKVPGGAQAPAIHALANLAQYGWSANGDWKDAMLIFVEVLSAEWMDLEMQRRVCWAIGYLSKNNTECQRLAVNARAGRAILRSMKRHEDAVAFQECGVGAWLPLSELPDGWKLIWKYDGVDVLTSAIARHSESELLHEEAFKLLLRISDTRATINSSGAVELAKQAQTHFPSMEVLHEFLLSQAVRGSSYALETIELS